MVQIPIFHVNGEDPEAVAQVVRLALDVAHAQSARAFELRAAMGLARVARTRGTPEKGRAILAPICAWFTEGLDMPELVDARALLARR